MLTFFDYLRQRAFEAVLSGVREALDKLEQPTIDPEQKDRSPGNGLLERGALTMKSGSESEEKLPPPRKRGPGRPRKNAKAKS